MALRQQQDDPVLFPAADNEAGDCLTASLPRNCPFDQIGNPDLGDSNGKVTVSSNQEKTQQHPTWSGEGNRQSAPDQQVRPAQNEAGRETDDTRLRTDAWPAQPPAAHPGRHAPAPESVSQTDSFPGEESFDKILQLVHEGNRVTFSVEPEGIGRVDISLRVEDGALHALVRVADESTRNLFGNNVHSLVDALSREGLSIAGFHVSLRNGETGTLLENRPPPAEDKGRRAPDHSERQLQRIGTSMVSIYI